ncbi:hypothetical protein DSECCO2_566200 [anaerobic digester metagenome]
MDQRFQFRDGRGRHEGDLRLAGLLAQLLLEVDQRQHGLVPPLQGVGQHVLGHELPAALDHDHGVAGGGEGQVEGAFGLDHGHGGVEDELAVHVAHAAAGDGAFEGDLGDVQRGRGGGQGQHVGLHLAVGRKHGGDDLHLVAEAFGEKRPAGAVDQAAHEHFALGGAADFAAEVGARDAPGGVGHFLVVHGEGEKAFLLGQGLRAGRDQHHGAAGLDPDGPVGLVGQAAGFEDDGIAADGGFESDRIERESHGHLAEGWGWTTDGVSPPAMQQARRPPGRRVPGAGAHNACAGRKRGPPQDRPRLLTLLAQSELRDQVAIALDVLFLQVV